MTRRHPWPRCLVLALLVLIPAVSGQTLVGRRGEPVPPEVERLYLRGLRYLESSVKGGNAWQDRYAMQPAVIGLTLLAFLAHGEDPNYGPYSPTIKKCLEFILSQQNKQNGYIGTSMYNHGFATLALAEAYGVVNDDRIGPALDQAVKLLLSSQAHNPLGAWRYNPESNDADTTVSGACLVALYAARNAGVAIPDKAFKRALRFYQNCQAPDGGFGYTQPSGSNAPRAGIGTLVFSLARDQDSRRYRAAYAYLNQVGHQREANYFYYYLYYASQAFFHGKDENWNLWNAANIELLKALQTRDGSWHSNHGPTYGTAMALLSLALNYRLLPIYER